MKDNSVISKLDSGLNKEYMGRSKDIWAGLVASVILFILNMPFISWFSLADAQKIVNVARISEKNIPMIHYHYNTFDLLSFVQYSGLGILGLYAMILLILMAATLYFIVAYTVKVIRNKRSVNGKLGILGIEKYVFIFEGLTAIASIFYGVFAEKAVGTKVFKISPVVYIVLVISVIAYVFVKRMEFIERKKYKEHGLAKELAKNWILFLMLVPTFVYFIINNYMPMVGVYYAFTNFNFRDGLWSSPFTGFKNFQFLLKADLFKLTRNTILYNVVFIVVGNILQVVFAILVSQVVVKWFKKTAQTLMFMPYFVSFVILKVLVYNMFEYEYGLVNNIVTQMGGGKIDFYNTPSYWPLLITLFYLWKNIGYGMVVYLATITGIDTELYEAAKVDGANIFQQIYYITLPLIKPTFIILLLYALGSIMKGQFELFYQMIGNNGVLYNITDIFDTYVYRITMTQPLSIGLGTAAGLYQSLFGFVIVMVTNWAVKRKNPEYALF